MVIVNEVIVNNGSVYVAPADNGDVYLRVIEGHHAAEVLMSRHEVSELIDALKEAIATL